MNSMITMGAYTITVDTAYKAAQLGLLAVIASAVTYIAYWIST